MKQLIKRKTFGLPLSGDNSFNLNETADGLDEEDAFLNTQSATSSSEVNTSTLVSISHNEDSSSEAETEEKTHDITLSTTNTSLTINPGSISMLLGKMSISVSDDEYLAANGDDSTDGGAVQRKLDSKELTTKWNELCNTNKNVLRTLLNGDISFAFRDSFLLHNTAISLLYGQKVSDIYRPIKKNELSAKQGKEALKQQIITSLVAAVRNFCLSIHIPTKTFKQVSEEAEKIYNDKGINKSLGDIADHLIKNRTFGRGNSKLLGNFVTKAVGKLFPLVEEMVRSTFGFKMDDSVPSVLDSVIRVTLEKLSLIKIRTASNSKNSLSPLKVSASIYKSPTAYARSKSYEEILNFNNERFPDNKQEFSAACKLAWELIRYIDTNKDVVPILQQNKWQLFSDFIADLSQQEDSLITKNFAELHKHISFRDEIDFKKSLEAYIIHGLESLKFNRPILQENYILRSYSLSSLLANIRLSNRSQTRRLRNEIDEEGFRLHGETSLRLWGFSKCASKQGMERQQITTNQARSDLIDNMGAYDEVLKDINKLKVELKLDDKAIAVIVRQILQGVELEALKVNDQNIVLKEVHKKILVNLVTLMFVTETARNPSSIVSNIMILDLIEAEKIIWQQALDCYTNGKERNGGISPMTMGKAVSAARYLNKKYGSPYVYQGDEAKDLMLVKELIKRESLVVSLWTNYIDEKDKDNIKNEAKNNGIESFIKRIQREEARWVGEKQI